MISVDNLFQFFKPSFMKCMIRKILRYPLPVNRSVQTVSKAYRLRYISFFRTPIRIMRLAIQICIFQIGCVIFLYPMRIKFPVLCMVESRHIMHSFPPDCLFQFSDHITARPHIFSIPSVYPAVPHTESIMMLRNRNNVFCPRSRKTRSCSFK